MLSLPLTPPDFFTPFAGRRRLLPAVHGFGRQQAPRFVFAPQF
jgi:hypothetical protein